MDNTDALHFVKEVGLKYIQDSQEGILRKRAGRGFFYVFKGKQIKDVKVLERIRSLVIPPAWKSVWISPDPCGHLQATGKDVRGRKQYRYHAEWSKARNETKFDKLITFGKVLPKIRSQINSDLKEKSFTKEKILASVVTIMENTCIRIGNEVYAQENNSFGLTTIRNKHVKVHGAEVKFHFRGKSGVIHDASLNDPNISKIIRHCQHLPGEELFSYKDENGSVHSIGSADVNGYLQKIAGESITAKEFRTWNGSVKALEETIAIGPTTKKTEAAFKKKQVEVITKVAGHLRNTVAVCRKYYVHPRIFEYDKEGLLEKMRRTSARKKKIPLLNKTENLLLDILQRT